MMNEEKLYNHLNHCKKPFIKNPTAISDFKTLRKFEREENYVNLIKNTYKKPKQPKPNKDNPQLTSYLIKVADWKFSP